MTDHPNFILFITVQHRANYLGRYGHPLLKTPNIDRMAENGVAYEMIFVAAPALAKHTGK